MKHYILLLFLLIQVSLPAQFIGGNKSGYALSFYQHSTTIYSGGTDGGYQVGNLTSLSIYSGSEGAGYAKNIEVYPLSIYNGGNQDGHFLVELESDNNIFAGGEDDGYFKLAKTSSFSIYSGGQADGYALDQRITSFIWTGLIGTGWNVEGNWKEGIIPNINSNVIIPAGVSNFPGINAGIMSIGKDFNSGTFLCKKLNIQSGAEMTLRVNAFLENYGDININGALYILNPDALAVQNLTGGHIMIFDGGTMEFNSN